MKVVRHGWTLIVAIAALGVCSCDAGQSEKETSYSWTTQLTRRNGEIVTKGMLIDTNADSIDPSKPAFMAPPRGSKAYHGFPLVPGIVIDGFRLGTITVYKQKDSPNGCTIGDAFVEAPDGSRAGPFWEVGKERLFFRIEEPSSKRWGVYYFSVPRAVTTTEDFAANFEDMLPKLKQLYESAKESRRD